MRLRRRGETPDDEGFVSAEPSTPTVGPFDVADIEDTSEYVDLGSLLLPHPSENLELRLQVEEETSEVVAVLLVGDQGVLELRAFASSRGSDLWATARKEIAADTTRRGGTASEQQGAFGAELLCQVPVENPGGQSMVQPSRVIGQAGARWLLRATIAGPAALDATAADVFEEALRLTVVNRGNTAMPPGEPLPLHLPADAQRLG